MSLAEHRDYFAIAEFRHHLKFGSRRLDDLDHGISTVIRQRKMFGTHAINCWTSITARRCVAESKRDAGWCLERRAAIHGDAALEHVHGRRADKPRDKKIVGSIIQLQWRTDLFDASVVHHNDLVSHSHGFDLVMCHVNGGGLQTLMQLLDLRA